MKTVLTSCWTAARRAVALWKMRSIEINLDAMTELYPKIEDMTTRLEMHRAIRVASKALAAARAEYQSFLPPGDRRVWDLA